MSSNWNLDWSISVCKDRSSSLRRLSFLEGTEEMFFVLFLQESLFPDAGHSVHFFVLVAEKNCPLNIIKELSTPDKDFATDTVLEKCIQTFHVLIFETEAIQFLKHLFNVAC